jgi:hypothetical protein
MHLSVTGSVGWPVLGRKRRHVIVFQTLLLGLVFGLQPVRLMVAAQVKSVEVRLDDATIGVLTGEPWSVQCDFGESPHPHELVVIGRDASGTEISHVRQWVNMPRLGAEATLLLERGPQPNRVVAARLALNEIEGTEPRTVRVTLDGQTLAIKDPKRFELPRNDPTQVHILSAELTFAEGRTARTQAVFGGYIGEEAQSELTGVPLVLEPGMKLPALPALQTWLREGNLPLRVLGVERGPFDVVLVLDQEARTILAKEHGAKGGGVQLSGRTGLPPQLLVFDPAGRDDNRLFIAFGVPGVFYGDDNCAHVVFPAYSPMGFVTSNLRARLANLAYESGVMGTPALADAVASMGALAAANNRPRAVVLLLAGSHADTSTITPSGARAYLEDLHVPLLVWSLTGGSESGGWGSAEDVSTEGLLDKAARHLKGYIGAQRIVWLEGAYLPQHIRLAEGVRGVHIAP